MVILNLNDFVTDLLISTGYKRVIIGGGGAYMRGNRARDLFAPFL